MSKHEVSIETIKAKQALAGLPIIAQAMARKTEVEIIFDPGAPTAATDGRRIILPALPIPVKDSPSGALERLAVYAYGYLDHEIGHVLNSDFSCFKKLSSEIEHSLLNAIEDPRQEVALIETYPGTRQSMDALSLQLIADDTQGVSVDQAPADLVAMTAHAWLRVALRNEAAYQPIADEGLNLIAKTLGEGVKHRLIALLAGEGMRMDHTGDALKLARNIIKMLKDEADKAQQQQEQEQQKQEQQSQGQQQEQQGEQSGQPNQSQGQGNQGSARDPQQSQGSQDGGPDQQQGQQNGAGDSQGQQGQQQGAGDKPGKLGKKGQKGGGAGGDLPPSTPEQAKALQDAASGEGAKGFEDRGQTVAKELKQASEEIKAQGPSYVMGEQRVKGKEENGKPVLGGPLDAAEAERASAKIKRRMNVLLEAKSRADNRVRDLGQRLSSRHLTNIAVQDARVFAHRSEIRRVDTAVMILTDCSGSMSGRQIEVANGGVYAASRAMESLRGVKVAAMTFPGNALLKGFDAPVLSVLENFKPSAYGGTPLTEALFSAARLLRTRREPRKLIIVLTDGQPNDPASARMIVKTLPSLGIEAYGIGIMHTAVEGLFGLQNSRVIDTIDDLPEALFGLLQKQLAA